MSSLHVEGLDRFRKAVALEPVDKIPFAPCAPAFFPLNGGISLKTATTDFEAACTNNIEQCKKFEADVTQSTVFSPYLLSTQWLSKVSIPGIDLGDDDLWQMCEQKDFMKQEDYYTIIENGFEFFFEKFKLERLDNINEKLLPYFQYAPIARERFAEAGVPSVIGSIMVLPFEYFCGGRSLESFFMDDLFEEPDLVEKAYEKTMEYALSKYQEQFDMQHPIGVWIGGWRSAPEMISPETFDRFVWPYMKAYAELCIKNNVVPIFHLDANWDRALKHFCKLPKGKCVMALDGKTDIQKAKSIVGDTMCIMGDVPPEMLTFGTYDNVYNYSVNLIKTIGPTGFIMASGCDVPPNAKPENIKAMVDAVNDNRF